MVSKPLILASVLRRGAWWSALTTPDLRLLRATKVPFSASVGLAERLRDDVLARGLLTPSDPANLPKSCISCRRIWWSFIYHFAAIGLRRIPGDERA